MDIRLGVVILAAGQGTRMKSDLPKVLHKLAGKPMLEHVVNTARQVGARDIYVVYGHGGEAVPRTLSQLSVNWVEQPEQLGTGHAVEQAIPNLADDEIALILYGDVPLIQSETLIQLVGAAQNNTFGLLTAKLDNPTGYGRIIRDDTGRVVHIVEEKDAKDSERKIQEINTGFMAVNAGRLKKWLSDLDNQNAQGEYYLTDVIAMAAQEGVTINAVLAENAIETTGVNNKVQLAQLEREYQIRQAREIMQSGVTLLDPQRFDLRGTLAAGKDVVIDINVVIEGDVCLGDRVYVGPNNVLRNVTIGNDVTIKPNCVIEDAMIGDLCQVGPFSRIRPDTQLSDHVHVGNFVEIKKSEVGSGSKINHLTYVGDTTVGHSVNIGAGTITCNYDGVNKHRTIIGDNAFIGSDTQLVAPVSVGDNATIGAGTTLTRDAPAGELTISRAKQVTISGWKRPVKKR
jgi:bifunctional UDP-N-acetylglucosamine pyrophosphorylase/glucosamine-1-phosphate N-acetyltransferase